MLQAFRTYRALHLLLVAVMLGGSGATLIRHLCAQHRSEMAEMAPLADPCCCPGEGMEGHHQPGPDRPAPEESCPTDPFSVSCCLLEARPHDRALVAFTQALPDVPAALTSPFYGEAVANLVVLRTPVPVDTGPPAPALALHLLHGTFLN
jgi:hypothetical protein